MDDLTAHDKSVFMDGLTAATLDEKVEGILNPSDAEFFYRGVMQGTNARQAAAQA